MFYIRTVKGSDKQVAREETLLLDGIQYHTNEVGVLRCDKPSGQHEITVGNKTQQHTVGEGETITIQVDA
jgi:hypothetical protein